MMVDKQTETKAENYSDHQFYMKRIKNAKWRKNNQCTDTSPLHSAILIIEVNYFEANETIVNISLVTTPLQLLLIKF